MSWYPALPESVWSLICVYLYVYVCVCVCVRACVCAPLSVGVARPEGGGDALRPDEEEVPCV